MAAYRASCPVPASEAPKRAPDGSSSATVAAPYEAGRPRRPREVTHVSNLVREKSRLARQMTFLRGHSGVSAAQISAAVASLEGKCDEHRASHDERPRHDRNERARCLVAVARARQERGLSAQVGRHSEADDDAKADKPDADGAQARLVHGSRP